MLNIELLTKVMDHIRAHPEEWDQDEWIRRLDFECRTVACFAGWTVLLSGAEPIWTWNRAASVWVDGERRRVREHARELLGLHRYEADILFATENTMDDLERRVNKIIADELLAREGSEPLRAYIFQGPTPLPVLV